jgi:virulence factor Mce-like protein
MNERKLLHERASGQALVGVFVVLAMGVFGWLLLSERDGTGSYKLIAGFNELNNVDEATAVKLRGFTIGQVEKIEFDSHPATGVAYFQVELGIDKNYGVPVGTRAQIRSSGLVGDSFIDLDVSEAGDQMLDPGSYIKGRDDPGMKQLIASITEMAHKLGGAGESIRRADLGYKLGHLGDSIHRMATTLDQVSHNADTLLVTTRQVVDKLGPDMQRVMEGIDRNLAQLEQTLNRTDTLVANTHGDIQGAVEAMRFSIERLDKVLTRVDTLMQNKEADVEETLSNLHKASSAVREISEHPWKLLTGQGVKDSVSSPTD